ncbi:MAG: ABC transporter permease [Anaerolineales bacterium]|nr:ABC transporter permease [Anaerolineales bacterium]
MNRIWLVFRHTYWEHVRRPGFYLVIFLFPALVVIAPIVLGFLFLQIVRMVIPPTSDLPIGLVDETGDLLAHLAEDGQGPLYQTNNLRVWQFETQLEAEMALRAGHIQAYVRFPESFGRTGEMFGRYRAETPPNIFVQLRLFNWLEAQTRGEVDEQYLARLREGTEIVHIQVQSPGAENGTETTAVSPDPTTEAPATNAAAASSGFGLVVMVLYLGRMMSIFTSGFMYESVRGEAKNRTIEILLTSVPASSFVGGKILGMLAVGITQLAVFSILPAIFFLWVGQFASRDPNLSFLLPDLPWGLFLLFIAGGYVLDQIVAAGTGLLRISGGAGPQVANLLGWLGMIGLIYAITLLPDNPDTPLAVAASLIPFVSPIALPMRLVFTEVPLWQTAVSALLLWGSSVYGVWLLSRLVQRNLVGYADRFKLWQWVREKWRGLWLSRSQVGTRP